MINRFISFATSPTLVILLCIISFRFNIIGLYGIVFAAIRKTSVCCILNQTWLTKFNEQMKHFFIKIYLSFYSRKGPTVYCCLRDRWRDIYSERGLLLVPYLLTGAWGCQRLHSLCKPYRHRRPNPLIGCVFLVWLSILCPLSKSYRVVLIYHVVSFRLHTCWTWLPWRAVIPLFTNHNVTACQCTRDH